jgi:hypothetical protein
MGKRRMDGQIMGEELGQRQVRLSEDEYLRMIEDLAHEVVEEACAEGWLTFEPEDRDQPPLRRAINRLARSLRFVHGPEDGCFED